MAVYDPQEFTSNVEHIAMSADSNGQVTIHIRMKPPSRGADVTPATPEWRRLIDSESAGLPDDGDVLPRLLHLIANTAHDDDRVLRMSLARIAAIVERRFKWTVDPKRALEQVAELNGTHWLLDALGPWSEGIYVALGDRAASWLRDLTDGDA